MHEHSRHKFASFESQTTRLSAVMWREMLEVRTENQPEGCPDFTGTHSNSLGP